MLKNLLYAENDPNDAFLFRRLVTKAGLGCMIHIVPDGEVAIHWLSGRNYYCNRELYPLPDVLICDVKMPVATGFELLEWVRKHERFRTLPVVMYSTSGLEADVKRATELGATIYIQKTPTCERVIEYLRSRGYGGVGKITAAGSD